MPRPGGPAVAEVATGEAEEAPTPAVRSGAGTATEVPTGGGGVVVATGGAKGAPTPAACAAAGGAKRANEKDAVPARAACAATKAAARASVVWAADAGAAVPAGEMPEVAEAPATAGRYHERAAPTGGAAAAPRGGVMAAAACGGSRKGCRGRGAPCARTPSHGQGSSEGSCGRRH
jgi:hypothetical protein